MCPSKIDFKPHSNDVLLESYNDLLPTGAAFDAKNIPDTTMYNLMKSFTPEMLRYENEVYEVIANYIPNFDDSFIDSWEQFVGIPDKSFDAGVFTTSERLRNVVIKLAYLNLQTNDDFIALATILGVEINIYSGILLPIPATNTIVIELTNLETLPSFPYTFPIQFGGVDEDLFVRLCNQQKPATDIIDFIYL